MNQVIQKFLARVEDEGKLHPQIQKALRELAEQENLVDQNAIESIIRKENLEDGETQDTAS